MMKIPRRLLGGLSEYNIAYVSSKENGRVKGYVQHETGPAPFDVKHDDKGFSVGSGSSKSRYHFKDEQK